MGRSVWDEEYAPLGALNLGSGGDQTAHVLWRIGADEGQDDALAGLSPEVFFVLVGTNNTFAYQGAPEATAAGIGAVVERLLEASPTGKVLLLGLLPRGATPGDRLRRINTRVNELIAVLGERHRVEFLDVGAVFTDADGRLDQSLMPDLLHPSEAGYRRLADAIRPTLERLRAAAGS